MFGWAMPFIPFALSVGNDYPIYTPEAQSDLMWSAWRGTFPLYMPGFAGGHSTASMTMGQLYHPIAWISSLMPGYWHGLALEWGTLFRLLSLGVAQLVLFRLLRRLRVPPVASFIGTLPVVYNLRMLDSFRYGASLESYVGMLLACGAAGFVLLDRGSTRRVALLALATYLLAVSGHPQWAFLGALMSGLFALLFPWTAAAIDPGRPPLSWAELGRYYGRVIAGFGSGALLAAPYALPFYFEFLKNNESRAEQLYAASLLFADSVRGAVDNLLYPMHTDVHGAFGGSALFLIAALFPLCALAKRPPPVLWVVYGIGAIAFLFSLGELTPVHAFMVRHLPLFNVFRAPGRIMLWMPVVVFPHLAWMLRPSSRRALFVVGAAALCVLAAAWYWRADLMPAKEAASPHQMFAYLAPWLDGVLLAIFCATAIALTLSAVSARLQRHLLVLCAVPMLAATWLCLFNGTWKLKKNGTPSFDAVAAARRASVNSQANSGYGMEMRTISEYRARGLAFSRDLGTVVHEVRQSSSDGEALRALARQPNAPLFVDRPVVPMSTATPAGEDRVDLVYNTSNRFVFAVAAARDGYFVLGLPWLPGFACELDGAAAPVAKANALFPSVFVPQGTHRIDFRFASRPFMAGVMVAFLTLASWIVVLASRRRGLVAAFAALSGALLAGLLSLWLFHGPSFGTNYHWKGQVAARDR
jgi:hypothetical protein